MFCRKCGSELADDALFCSKCGASVTAEPTATTVPTPPITVVNKQTKTRRDKPIYKQAWLWILVGLIILAAGAKALGLLDGLSEPASPVAAAPAVIPDHVSAMDFIGQNVGQVTAALGEGYSIETPPLSYGGATSLYYSGQPDLYVCVEAGNGINVNETVELICAGENGWLNPWLRPSMTRAEIDEAVGQMHAAGQEIMAYTGYYYNEMYGESVESYTLESTGYSVCYEWYDTDVNFPANASWVTNRTTAEFGANSAETVLATMSLDGAVADAATQIVFYGDGSFLLREADGHEIGGYYLMDNSTVTDSSAIMEETGYFCAYSDDGILLFDLCGFAESMFWGGPGSMWSIWSDNPTFTSVQNDDVFIWQQP